jgi:hypothetical protein
MDSLEYGRSIHAEMNAITDAARGGHSIRGSTLYCNTFPCHNCAKHIVAAGISRVVYSRPYSKSYARELFSDSISIDHSHDDASHISFDQFIGILGSMYHRVFAKSKWKSKDGTVPAFDPTTAVFIRQTPIPSYLQTELLLGDELLDKLVAAGLLPEPSIDDLKSELPI